MAFKIKERKERKLTQWMVLPLLPMVIIGGYFWPYFGFIAVITRRFPGSCCFPWAFVLRLGMPYGSFSRANFEPLQSQKSHSTFYAKWYICTNLFA